MELLTISNPKTEQDESKGYLTGILHLAPSDLSGFNTCPKASQGCKQACLNKAGRGRFDKVQRARIRKARLFFQDRKTFFKLLIKDINAIIRKAERENLIPCIRLNGMSDIPFERVHFDHNGKKETILSLFPGVQFYDYTAIPGRKNLKNLNLTFSRKEDNDQEARETPLNVAVVFHDTLPPTWNGRPVIDGTKTDLRFLDPEGVIVGLIAKGPAKKDKSGFVIK